MLAIYYEGGTVDRHWLAPAGLSLTDAKKQRASPLYKTRAGAMRALDARQDRAQRRALAHDHHEIREGLH